MYNFKDEDLETIIDLEQHPVLEISGEEDEDGFQIFTPEFIVNDMIKMVGMENIKDISKTILEPTSGDGAFTVRILEMRLNSLLGDNEYLRKSLISLSTIFSIEMDNKLMAKQRNNIYTLLLIYAKKANLAISNDYIKLAKQIILTNFILGETNIDNPIKFKDDALGWYIDNTKQYKTKNNRIKFANWSISSNLIDSSYELEDWESNSSETDNTDLGGIFDVY